VAVQVALAVAAVRAEFSDLVHKVFQQIKR
jgi:hypothetical protein